MPKIKLPQYLQLRWSTYHVVLDIPKDVRPKFAGKPRFTRSLQTDSLSVAERTKWKHINDWKALIDSARKGKSQDYLAMMRAELAAARSQEEKDQFEEAHWDTAVEIAQDTGDRSAMEAHKIAYGQWVKLDEVLPIWTKRKVEIDEVKPKTLDTYTSIVTDFLKRFTYLHEVDANHVRLWLGEKGLELKSKKLWLTAIRGFLSVAGAPKNLLSDVIVVEDIPRSQRQKRKVDKRQHWEDVDIQKLYVAARANDPQLADLIKLGAFSGCRIEELCELQTSDVTSTVFKIRGAKTDAGDRDLPIHKNLTQLVTRLIDQSEDGYLLSGLTFNKYGDRSNAIGKRFGRLKTSLGYDGRYVFHSFRKSFITKLERAKVPESTISRLVGHKLDEGRSLALSVYSGGLTYEELKPVVDLVRYPEAPELNR